MVWQLYFNLALFSLPSELVAQTDDFSDAVEDEKDDLCEES